MGKLKLQSKVKTIYSAQDSIFNFLSDFNNIGKLIPPDKVQDLHCEKDYCQFTVQGMPTGLKILNAEDNHTIKYTSIEDSKFSFFFWIQLKEVAPYDTKFRLTAHVEMNAVMRMAMKKKLQEGLDSLADAMSTMRF